MHFSNGDRRKAFDDFIYSFKSENEYKLSDLYMGMYAISAWHSYQKDPSVFDMEYLKSLVRYAATVDSFLGGYSLKTELGEIMDVIDKNS